MALEERSCANILFFSFLFFFSHFACGEENQISIDLLSQCNRILAYYRET